VGYKLKLEQALQMQDRIGSALIGCLHDRANIEQLARRSMVISMLIKKAGEL